MASLGPDLRSARGRWQTHVTMQGKVQTSQSHSSALLLINNTSIHFQINKKANHIYDNVDSFKISYGTQKCLTDSLKYEIRYYGGRIL